MVVLQHSTELMILEVAPYSTVNGDSRGPIYHQAVAQSMRVYVLRISRLIKSHPHNFVPGTSDRHAMCTVYIILRQKTIGQLSQCSYCSFPPAYPLPPVPSPTVAHLFSHIVYTSFVLISPPCCHMFTPRCKTLVSFLVSTSVWQIQWVSSSFLLYSCFSLSPPPI